MTNLDLNNLVTAISQSAPAGIRFRQGVIQSVQSNGTATVQIAGSTTNISGIKVASHTCPVPGASCFLATDGRDWFILNTFAPTGPAWGAMRQSAAQSIPNATLTALSWANRTDIAANGVTVGNSGLTCVVPGLYQITGQVSFVTNITGQRHCLIQLNGNTIIHGSGSNASTGTEISRHRADGLWNLAINDVINLAAYQNSTAALNTQTGAGYTLLRMVWIGPGS